MDPTWTNCDYSNLKVGDTIRAQTSTFSQKWMLREGYEDCNATYQGKIISLGSEETQMIIQLADGTKRYAVQDVGSSGLHNYWVLK